jgi:cytochrome c
MAKRLGKAMIAPLVVGIAGLGIIVLGVQTMRQPAMSRPYRDVPGGDIERGREALIHYKCGSCHQIPGIEGANGTRGQSLGGIAFRSDIVGALPNAPEDIVRWIRDPKAIYPQTTMPNVNVSQEDAVDMVAYLYALPP